MLSAAIGKSRNVPSADAVPGIMQTDITDAKGEETVEEEDDDDDDDNDEDDRFALNGNRIPFETFLVPVDELLPINFSCNNVVSCSVVSW